MAHHAEIQQGKAIVLGDEDISGMWVRVKETIDQNLLEISAKQFFGQGRAIQLQQPQWTQTGDFLARNEIHSQDPGGSEVFNRFGNDDVLKLAQASAQPNQIVCLAFEIKFAQQTGAQLSEHV